MSTARLGLWSSGIVIGLVFAFVIARVYATYEARPKDAETQRAFEESNGLMSRIQEYRKGNNGKFPCSLSELKGGGGSIPKLDPPGNASGPGWYQATTRSFFIYLRNPGGVGLIRWGGSPDWYPCSLSGSCPPGDFARHCCDKPGYPKCDLH